MLVYDHILRVGKLVPGPLVHSNVQSYEYRADLKSDTFATGPHKGTIEVHSTTVTVMAEMAMRKGDPWARHSDTAGSPLNHVRPVWCLAPQCSASSRSPSGTVRIYSCPLNSIFVNMSGPNLPRHAFPEFGDARGPLDAPEGMDAARRWTRKPDRSQHPSPHTCTANSAQSDHRPSSVSLGYCAATLVNRGLSATVSIECNI